MQPVSFLVLLFGTVGSLTSPRVPQNFANCNRRTAMVGGISILTPIPVWARNPGSFNVDQAALQIQDASVALRQLQKDWALYAVINDEGRAGDNTEAARRILGGVKPRAGDAALDYAKDTPLYRIDNAFLAIRKAALQDDTDKWTSSLDLERFEELADRITFAVQKADSDFYSVLFAAKGSSMLESIYKGAKGQVDQGILDLDETLKLLRAAGAPGLS